MTREKSQAHRMTVLDIGMFVHVLQCMCFSVSVSKTFIFTPLRILIRFLGNASYTFIDITAFQIIRKGRYCQELLFRFSVLFFHQFSCFS